MAEYFLSSLYILAVYQKSGRRILNGDGALSLSLSLSLSLARDGVTPALSQPCRALSPINKPHVLRKHLGVTYLSDMHPVSVDHRQEGEGERGTARERARPIAELAPRRFRCFLPK